MLENTVLHGVLERQPSNQPEPERDFSSDNKFFGVTDVQDHARAVGVERLDGVPGVVIGGEHLLEFQVLHSLEGVLVKFLGAQSFAQTREDVPIQLLVALEGTAQFSDGHEAFVNEAKFCQGAVERLIRDANGFNHALIMRFLRLEVPGPRAVISKPLKQVFRNASSGILDRMRLMQHRKPARSTRAEAPGAARRGSPVALSVLGGALALMGVVGAGMNLAHAGIPWPTEFLASDGFLEAVLRTFVTAVLGACLIVVLYEPASDQARVRTDDPEKR
jgi:hypothetical protein